VTPRPVLVAGGGARFYSGVSLYTALLTRALADAGTPVAVLTARQLCPSRLYPGRARLGQVTTGQLPLPADAAVCDSLDWWPSAGTVRAWRFVWRQRPQVVVLQWWTVTLLHQYLIVAALVRLRGGRVVIEFHETFDTGEVALPLVRRYGRAGLWLLARMASFALVHSDADRVRVPSEVPLGTLPVHVVLHGPYPTSLLAGLGRPPAAAAAPPAGPAASPKPGGDGLPDGRPRLLFFGVVRPYKGVDVLADAVALVTSPVSVTVAGEPWGPDERALLGRLADAGATVIDRYVSDAELAALVDAADLVVLPYRHSAASGPLAVAMAAGLPVVVSDLAPLREAAEGYAGVRFAAPGDPAALAAAIDDATANLVGRRFDDPRSWNDTAERVLTLLTDADGTADTSLTAPAVTL
jgi:glycosyltransferase involved in cell wall biosynthesis